jgi:hypothetical protein
LELRPDGRAKIVKVDGPAVDLTADLPVPEFKVSDTRLRVECARGDGEIRLAMWTGDTLITELVDTDAKRATGPPGFGLYTGQPANAATRTYFDDFAIDRLPE